MTPSEVQANSVQAPIRVDRWVVCLCAEWCNLCSDYREIFGQLAEKFSGSPQYRFAWLDIEDEEDLVGELDIETFPTLVVADTEGVFFLGALLPHASTLVRLLESLEDPTTKRSAHGPVTSRLLNELPELSQHWI